MHACSWYWGSEVLGCRTLRLESQSSTGLRMQPYPRSLDLVWPGHLHGTGCLSARAMDTGFPTVAWRFCLGLGCGWVPVSAAPRHSWLGCWGVCALVCALRLYPATPGWGVRCGCVWLGSGSGCAPPLLAGVSGFVSACVRAPLAPRHSWLGCAAWVCVLPLGFWLRPATPGWGVGVCVCLCGCSACTPPLLAGACGVRVCAWAPVSVAPRHSWLRCWGAFVFVGALYLYPATPGWGVRWGCVCFGSGFGCTPPLSAGVLGCVCAGVGAPLAPRGSWLGCAPWVCVFGLGFRLHPATPGWGVGLCFCWCGRSACTPPLLAGVRAVGVCVWARVSGAPRHSWLGCWAVCVLVCVPPLYPATPGWGVRCGCVCLGSGLGCAPPLLAGVLGCVFACVRAPPVPRLSWLGCAMWLCVLGLGFQLRPATPGWAVGLCVCSCARSACTLPLLARVRGVGVCVWARVSAAPLHSWPGCWAVCVLVCALRLQPATLGWGARCGCVCLGSGFGCGPPLLAGVLGCVCAGVGAPLAPRHSWLGCAVWVCVLGLGFRLRPATPGWVVGVCVFVCLLPLYPATLGRGARSGCVCLGSHSGCTPPLLAGMLRCACLCACPPCTPPVLAGVCGGGVCVWALVSAAPRHSWLGCWAVCVLVWALRLNQATPGLGARRVCVCLGSGFGCAPPLLAGVLGCVCAGVGAPLAPCHSWLGCAPWVCVFGLGFRLHPATPGWGVGLCMCWCARSACIPPLLAGVCGGGVCVWARVSAAPRHCWLGCWGVWVLVWALRLHPATPGWDVRWGCVCLGSGLGCSPLLLAGVCAMGVCVFGLGFRLRPATPGWGVGLCVCSCACPPCIPPLLAGVCGVGVCVWARVSAAPRHSWLGCWAVCLLVCVILLYLTSPGCGARCGCVC